MGVKIRIKNGSAKTKAKKEVKIAVKMGAKLGFKQDLKRGVQKRVGVAMGFNRDEEVQHPNDVLDGLGQHHICHGMVG